MIDFKEMGERIRGKRIELNLTQEELAKRVGYTSRSSINKIELGLVNLPQSKIISIADALNVSTSYIMGTNKQKLVAKINQNMAHNIQFYREQADLTQDQFAEMLGVDSKTVAVLENGDYIPDKELMFRICDTLNVTPDFLDGSISELLEEGDLDAEYRLLRSKKAPDIKSNAIFLDEKNFYLIPVFESVSAGFGALATDSIVEYTPLYFNSPVEAEESICIKVSGDSMFPKIENGDIIQIHKQESVDSGTIAVVLLDGEEGLVKKVMYGADWIELHSINPMYPVMRFEKEEVLRLKVLGKVKKIIKNV